MLVRFRDEILNERGILLGVTAPERVPVLRDELVGSAADRRFRSMGVPPMREDHGQDARATCAGPATPQSASGTEFAKRGILLTPVSTICCGRSYSHVRGLLGSGSDRMSAARGPHFASSGRIAFHVSQRFFD